ncbi:ABC transporter substrate-binding protein [Candidatus Contubernalis alkalaceticus]|nr:ABC transporter substrate-binding protein [Candidatus Contubernalis alkalaceticus]
MTWERVNFPGGDSRFVWSQIFETLVRLDTELNQIPGLATSWEASEGGKVWTFYLREGVQFHDGTPFNAEAVIHSYDEESYAARTTVPVEEIIAEDEHTVTFVLSRVVDLPTYLTHVAWPIMSPASYDDSGSFKGPSGTGPFSLEKHITDQEVIVVRNENYWGEKATLDKVIFQVIPDPSTRVMALEAGQVDMALKLNESDAERLRENPEIEINTKLSTFTDFLQFNTKKAPLDDYRIRQAISLAIDTESIVSELLVDIGVPAMGRPLSPVMKYSNTDLKIQPDPQKSREILDEAGWEDKNGDGILEKDGTVLELTAILSAWSPRQKISAEAIQGQLREVGIDLKLLIMESGAESEAEERGDFDILVRTGYLTWGDYPHHLKMHTSHHPFSHYANEEYDPLVMRGESADLTEEEKWEVYEQAQRHLMEFVPAVYLIHEEKVVAARSNVKDYQISAEDPWLNLMGITIE